MRLLPLGHRFGPLAGLMAALSVASCSDAARAPGAPSLDEDASLEPPDAQQVPAIDCKRADEADDADGDGFSRVRGDCDDCDFSRGPGALDLADNDIDEDCDGEGVANVVASC